jgi:hypothetical protein
MDKQYFFSLLVAVLLITVFYRIVSSPKAADSQLPLSRLNETLINLSGLPNKSDPNNTLLSPSNSFELEKVDIPEFQEESKEANNATETSTPSKKRKNNRKNSKKSPVEQLEQVLFDQLGKLKINFKLRTGKIKKQSHKIQSDIPSSTYNKKQVKARIKNNEEIIKIFGAIETGLYLKPNKEEALNYTINAISIYSKNWNLEEDPLSYGFFLLSYATTIKYIKILRAETNSTKVSFKRVSSFSPLYRGIQVLEDRVLMARESNIFVKTYVRALEEFIDLMNLTNNEEGGFEELLQFWQYFYSNLLPQIFQTFENEKSESEYLQTIEKGQKDFDAFFQEWRSM